MKLAKIADELTAKAASESSTSVLVKPSEKDVAAVTMGVGSKAVLLAVVIGAASTVSASDFDYDFNSRLQSMQEQRAILRGEDPADAVIRAQTNSFINPCK